MEAVYACGVICIEFIQSWFKNYAEYFENVNDLANPHHGFELFVPIVGIFDSVFASQYLLCMAFGSWLNAVLKWCFLEERPYWWVRETTYYKGQSRPTLAQTSQTCETGPGSPSGHAMIVAMELLLIVMWISHVMNDRKCYVWWWKHITYPICAVVLASTMLARLYVAAHFPHQVVLGAIIGAFLAPALCIYISDPAVWGHRRRDPLIQWRHTALSLTAVVTACAVYWGLKWLHRDPMWSVQMAFRWCQVPENIHVSTTPVYALVQSTGSLLGWALAATAAVDKYRHNTKARSLIIATTVQFVFVYLTRYYQEIIPREKAWLYYLLNFIVYAAKPALFLRVTPFLAMLPFKQKVKTS
ncbi:glucose-6-phosphatase 2 [Plutella xylostella]|uniref:glucose-6-phosphatase 2 n=1 Tax=Plutella xylostella TaxID=51655 RepID=UPI0020328853|nr:glucose-6-phosphatase 2 [Plutella xylostella]